MDNGPGSVGLDVEPGSLTIAWPNGRASTFSSLWLRDNCPEDRDLQNGQRLIDVAELPEAPRIAAAGIRDGVLWIDWDRESRRSAFELAWLAQHAPGTIDSVHEFTPRLWLRGAVLEPHEEFSWAAWDRVRASPPARLAWLERLLEDGIAFLTGVPAEESTLLECAALMGRVCETNYGLVFDVRSVPQPENLAYSDRGLGLHTDNPYREPVPGFQALHVLRSSPDGGASVFADGFAIAEHLRACAPAAFETLTRTPVPFLYRSADAELYAKRPLLQLTCDGKLAAVHYNNRSIAPIRLPPAEAAVFYSSYRRFAALLRDPGLQLPLHLGDGELVVFDNQRILHGRTAFSAARFPRHLRGCYLTRDSVYCEVGLLRRRLRGSEPKRASSGSPAT